MKIGKEENYSIQIQRRWINSKFDGLCMEKNFEVEHKFELLTFIQLFHQTFEFHHHNFHANIHRDLFAVHYLNVHTSLLMWCLVGPEKDKTSR